jgi:dTDP-glucose 4,6-dehydratase
VAGDGSARCAGGGEAEAVKLPTYLVTGGCGFIGSNFVHFVLAREPQARVVVVDNLSFAANPANLDAVRGRITLVVDDICNYEGMLEAYRQHQPDFVVNFAAESHNDRAVVDPSSFARTNALGAQTLLEVSRRQPVRRHLHVSTIEVYGELAADAPFFTEGSPLNAKTPYSAAKAAGDQFVRAYMQTYREMDIAMTHCANNYGPYQFPEKLIPLMITNVLRGKKVPVYGDGLQMRDWLHVQDHCAAIWAILHAPKTQIAREAALHPELLPIFDVSARNEMTNLAICRRVLELLGKRPEEWIEHVPDRPNHDQRYLIDPSKLEQRLGWKPSIEFDRGIDETVRWYVDRRSWWQDILVRGSARAGKRRELTSSLAQQALGVDAAAIHELLRQLALALDQLAGRAFRHDRAARQEVHAIGDAQRARHVVRDDDAGHAETLARLLDQIVDPAAGDRVQAAGRLVVDDDIRLHDHGARQRDALAHAARKLAGEAILGALEPQDGQLLQHALADLLGAQPRVLSQRKRHVVHHRQRVEQRGVLKHHAELLAHGVHRPLAERHDVLTVHVDRAAGRLVEADQQPQERGLAGAGTADHDGDLTAPDGEVHVPERDEIAETLGDAFRDQVLVAPLVAPVGPSRPPAEILLLRLHGPYLIGVCGCYGCGMSEEHLSALLAAAEAKRGSDGWSRAADGRLLTLYVASGGASITIGRVEAVKLDQGVVMARTSRGETYVAALADVFAGAVEAPAAAARKAGFA